MGRKGFLSVIKILCIVVLVIGLTGKGEAQQANKQETVVKIGCVDIINFLQLQGNTANGYGAEYLREIGNITGWRYEYVQGSWSQCLQWLREGKIDLLLPAEYSEERAREFLFSKQECCTDYVMLLIDAQRKDLYYEDYAHYNGMIVGMIRDNYLNKYFADYAQSKGFSYKTRYYDTGKQLSEAISNKEIDAMVTGNLDVRPNSKIIAKFDFMSAYFIMPKTHEKLMKQLDDALYFIQVEKPYFRAQLYEKYYISLGEQGKVFTREEAEYIAKAPVLRVVADNDNRPFEWYDDEQKKYRGIDLDIIKEIAANSGLKLELIRTPTLKDSWNMLKEGKADILLGVYLDEALSNQYKVYATSFYLDKKSVAIGRRGENIKLGEPHTMALSESLIGTERYIQTNYPQWNVQLYPNQEACLKAVAEGKADTTLMGILYMQTTPILEKYPSLAALPGISISLPLAFGVSHQTSPLLRDVLNKAILAMSRVGIQQSVIDNTVTQRDTFDLHNFIKYNPLSFGIIILLAAIIIGSLLFLLYRSRIQKLYTKELAAKNEELYKAKKATEVFFSQLSHDMRTPMNAILGFTELGLDSKDNEELLDYFDKIKVSGQYLLRLINDSLEVSKINNGKINFQPEACTLSEMSVVLEDVLRVKANKKHITLTFDMGPFPHQPILLDNKYVEQILVNLLNNSLKFTPNGGVVQLSIDKCKIETQGYLQFKVSDNGCGMSKEFVEQKLYLPFEQENCIKNPEEEGTGLGLVIAKRLVEHMHGYIRCDSAPQSGTCFTILLPLVFSSNSIIHHAEQIPIYQLEGKRVIVCEDHPLNMVITTKLLEKKGIQVEQAKNGQECIEVFSASPEHYYDGILMDVRMPVMDGLTATKRIRALAREDAKSIPIIAMTANNYPEDIKECLAAGMNAFLGKPVEPKLLYETLQIWLARKETGAKDRTD